MTNTTVGLYIDICISKIIKKIKWQIPQLVYILSETYSNSIRAIVYCAMKNFPSRVNRINCFAITPKRVGFQPFLRK